MARAANQRKAAKPTGFGLGVLAGLILSMGGFVLIAKQFPLPMELDRVEDVPIPRVVEPKRKPIEVDPPLASDNEVAETESIRPEIPEESPVEFADGPVVVELPPTVPDVEVAEENPVVASPTGEGDDSTQIASGGPAVVQQPSAEETDEAKPTVVATTARVKAGSSAPSGVGGGASSTGSETGVDVALAPAPSMAPMPPSRMASGLSAPDLGASRVEAPSQAPAAPPSSGSSRPVVRSGTQGLGSARVTTLVAPAPQNEGAPSVDNTSAVPVLGGGATTTAPAPSAATAPAPAPAAAPAPAPQPEVVAGTPWKDNAAAYPATSKALLGVVLRDAGRDGVDLDQLTSMGFPVTVAIPVDMIDAEGRANKLRAAGFEVLAALPANEPIIKKGASAADIEKRLDQLMRILPGAVGLMDNTNGVISTDNSVARIVTAYFAKKGYALVTHRDFGIDLAYAAAQGAGTPAVAVDGLIDVSFGRSGIQAELNNASFSAQRDGYSVILGDTRPDLIQTLFTWMFSSGVRSMQMSPVTATIQRDLDNRVQVGN